jgi:hypothetical protein
MTDSSGTIHIPTESSLFFAGISVNVALEFPF